MAPLEGMGADRIVEATIVTADGQVRTVNECSNPDLFWAVKGGGGGTFGAVTRVVMKVIPDLTGQAVVFNANFTFLAMLGSSFTKDTVTKSFLTMMAQNQPTWSGMNAGGQIFVFPFGYKAVSVGGYRDYSNESCRLTNTAREPGK